MRRVVLKGFDYQGNLLGEIVVPRIKIKRRITQRLAKKRLSRLGVTRFEKEKYYY